MILCHCNNVRTGDEDSYHLIGTNCGRCKMEDKTETITLTIPENYDDMFSVNMDNMASQLGLENAVTFTTTPSQAPEPHSTNEGRVEAFLRRLLDPEGFGHAVTAEVRDEARVLLGMARVETLTDQQLEDHGIA